MQNFAVNKEGMFQENFFQEYEQLFKKMLNQFRVQLSGDGGQTSPADKLIY